MMFIVPVVICCLKIVTKKKLMTIYVPYAGLSYFSSASSFFKEVQKETGSTNKKMQIPMPWICQ